MSDWQNVPELDVSIISTLKGAIGDAAFAGMSGQFAEDLSNLCTAFNEARARESVDAAREAAHAIKGAAANIGLARLSALAADMESGDHSDADRLAEVFGSAIEKLRTA